MFVHPRPCLLVVRGAVARAAEELRYRPKLITTGGGELKPRSAAGAASFHRSARTIASETRYSERMQAVRLPCSTATPHPEWRSLHTRPAGGNCRGAMVRGAGHTHRPSRPETTP